MGYELEGLKSPRRGPVAVVASALAVMPLAVVPITSPAGWVAATAGCLAVPWLAGRFSARRPWWRLSERGLEQISGRGSVLVAYERHRIEEIVLTSDDRAVMIYHRFGGTLVGTLDQMGFELFDFFIAARQLGIETHVIDGDQTLFDDERLPISEEEPKSLGRRAEERLRNHEAALLAASCEPMDDGPADVPAASISTDSAGRRFAAIAGVVGALACLAMFLQPAIAASAHGMTLGGRLGGAAWAAAGILIVWAARRRRLATAPLVWRLGNEGVRVRQATIGAWGVSRPMIAAVVISTGVTIDPVRRTPEPETLSALVYGHRMELLARLPARRMDAFQLTHALHEQGYRVIADSTGAFRSVEYGLGGLPGIFSDVPGGRLVVDEDGIGWADGAGDVVLRMPRDRISGIELLTVDGRAWLRLYDSDGDEFLAAPLSILRIARSDLRLAASRARLPVIDAEYDAYLSATLYGTLGTSATTTEPPVATLRPIDATDTTATVLDVPRPVRAIAYAVTAAACEVLALAAAAWLNASLGGLAVALAWAAPSGMVLGLVGAWLNDRHRPQLRVSTGGMSAVSARRLRRAKPTRRRRAEWSIAREAIGGVGIDDSDTRRPRLVVWSPTGRVLKKMPFVPHLAEVRRACERHGLPWGPPDADIGTIPPPEM